MRNIVLAFIFASFFTSKVFAGCISGNCEYGYGTWLFGNGSEYIGDFLNGNLCLGTDGSCTTCPTTIMNWSIKSFSSNP